MASRLLCVLRWAEHVLALWAAVRVARYVRQVGLRALVMKLALAAVKRVPGGASLLAREQGKTVEAIRAFTQEPISADCDDIGDVLALPEVGMSADALLLSMRKLRGAERDYNAGKAFGGIYCDDKALKACINSAYCEYSDSNALFPGIFPALRKFELDVVRICKGLLHGSAAVQVETLVLLVDKFAERY
jgi:hypothetical protein